MRFLDLLKKEQDKKPARSVELASKQIMSARNDVKKNGFTEYVFLANSDCCEVCRNLHNKPFKISKLKIGVNAPPMHEGCRCSIAAHSDRKKYEKWLNSL